MTNAANDNTDVNQTYDAQALVEDIDRGEEKAPRANVEADYEASKQYSQSSIDQTGAGAEAAKAATSPKLDIPQATEPPHPPSSTGNPDEFKEMAKDVNPRLKA